MTISAYAIPGIKECDREDIFSVDAKVNSIVRKICVYFNVEERRVKSKVRRREIVLARQFCMYFIRKNLSLTLKQTADVFGRDHTTAIHSIDFIKSQLSIPVPNSIKSDFEKLIQIV